LVDSGASGAGWRVARMDGPARRILKDVARVGLGRSDSPVLDRCGRDRQVRHGAGRSGWGPRRPGLGHDETDQPDHGGLDRRVSGRAGLRLDLARVVRAAGVAVAAALVALAAGLAQLLWLVGDPNARSSS